VLEPWIIEQIRRREEEERRRHERPRLEIPLRDEHRRPEPEDEGDPEEDHDAPQRGVVIIEM
jgi:hypothetical protein